MSADTLRTVSDARAFCVMPHEKAPACAGACGQSLERVAASEFVLHRNPEQVAGIVEAADQMIAGG
ncbi:MAG TPA: hypothetical protein VJN66_06880, partial [Rhodanobacteraceae bacterium]|nr:hypothetical protein [Rhodanobacteraceae bacterium]